MNGEGALPTREQRIVDHLANCLPADPAMLERTSARAHSLPALLRRHGPVQTLLFLVGKGERYSSDAQLAGWLVSGVSAALGTDELGLAQATPQGLRPYPVWLARRPLPAYLLRWEAMVEVAGWLKMLIAARTEAGARP